MSQFDTRAVVKAGVRSAAASIPGLASWVQMWNERDAVELERKYERFWKAFVLEVQRNESRFAAMEASIDRVSEALAITERAFIHARSDPSAKRQERFAQAAVSAIAAGESVDYDTKVSVIDALNVLTDTDIDILQRFASGKTIRVERMTEAAGVGPEFLDSLGRLIATLAKLESRGLISQTNSKGTFNVTSSAGDPGHWTNVWKNRDYEILPFGSAVLTLLDS